MPQIIYDGYEYQQETDMDFEYNFDECDSSPPLCSPNSTYLTWVWHVWNEVFVAVTADDRANGEGYWLVQDATDYIGSSTGNIDDFIWDYGTRWEPSDVWSEPINRVTSPDVTLPLGRLGDYQ